MQSKNRLFVVTAVLFCFAFSLSAADKKNKDAKSDDTAKPSYEMTQPAVENIDLTLTCVSAKKGWNIRTSWSMRRGWWMASGRG